MLQPAELIRTEAVSHIGNMSRCMLAYCMLSVNVVVVHKLSTHRVPLEYCYGFESSFVSGYKCNH